MAVRCKEMTERLKIIEDQEIEAIEAIDVGLEFELAACNLELLNKVGRPGVCSLKSTILARKCTQGAALSNNAKGVRRPGKSLG